MPINRRMVKEWVKWFLPNGICDIRFGALIAMGIQQPWPVGDLLLVRNGQEMAAFRPSLAGG